MRSFLIVHPTTTFEKYILRALVYADSAGMAVTAIENYCKLNKIGYFPSFGLLQVHDLGVVSSFPCPAIQSVEGGHIMIVETASYQPPTSREPVIAHPPIPQEQPRHPTPLPQSADPQKITPPVNSYPRPQQSQGNRGRQQGRPNNSK